MEVVEAVVSPAIHVTIMDHGYMNDDYRFDYDDDKVTANLYIPTVFVERNEHNVARTGTTKNHNKHLPTCAGGRQ